VAVEDSSRASVGRINRRALGICLYAIWEDPRVLSALFEASLPSFETALDELGNMAEAAFPPDLSARLVAS
jgi:hypothetical protein